MKLKKEFPKQRALWIVSKRSYRFVQQNKPDVKPTG
jgi:hypothetical protein